MRGTQRATLISQWDAESVPSNLGECWQGHPALTMTSEYYTANTGFAFVYPHIPGNYPPTMVNVQDQELGTKSFRHN